MEDLRIRQGETLSLTVVSQDDTAVSVRFIASKPNNFSIIDITAPFEVIDGKTVAQIQTTDTNADTDDYEYMLTITYADDTVLKLPDATDCEDGCTLPTLTICEALDLEIS